MARILIFLVALIFIGCPSYPSAGPATSQPSSTIASDVQALLEQLYGSFNYGPGQEPDWVSMRASFVDGGQFVPEPTQGARLRSYDVDALIAKWQTSMRSSSLANNGYSEWIDSTTASQVGDLLRVDVVFYGKEPGDPHPRKAGMDSLLLARVDGTWKVLSFVVHTESKL